MSVIINRLGGRTVRASLAFIAVAALPRSVRLELASVTGLDVTAAVSFEKIATLAEEVDAQAKLFGSVTGRRPAAYPNRRARPPPGWRCTPSRISARWRHGPCGVDAHAVRTELLLACIETEISRRYVQLLWLFHNDGG